MTGTGVSFRLAFVAAALGLALGAGCASRDGGGGSEVGGEETAALRPLAPSAGLAPMLAELPADTPLVGIVRPARGSAARSVIQRLAAAWSGTKLARFAGLGGAPDLAQAAGLVFDLPMADVAAQLDPTRPVLVAPLLADLATALRGQFVGLLNAASLATQAPPPTDQDRLLGARFEPVRLDLEGRGGGPVLLVFGPAPAEPRREWQDLSARTLEGIGGLGVIGLGIGGSGATIGPDGRVGPRPKGSLSPGRPRVDEKEGGSLLTAGEISGVVRRHAGGIKRCYEKALRRDPKMRGRISVAFTIGGDGKVIGTKVESKDLDDEELLGCVRRRIERMRFPAPRGEGVVQVTYPFLFKPE